MASSIKLAQLSEFTEGSTLQTHLVKLARLH